MSPSVADFLAAVVPAGVLYIVERVLDDAGKPRWFHVPASSPVDGEIKARRALEKRRDVYFAPAAYQQAFILDHRTGKRRPSRELGNIHSLRSFWLDIDVQHNQKFGNNVYGTAAEALTALKAFLHDAKLPAPQFIVSSGNGLHVYWVTDTLLPLQDWQPIASALANAAQKFGMRCDYTVSKTATAILRVPSTVNFKDPTHPKAVQMLGAHQVLTSLQAMRDALVGFQVSGPLTPATKGVNADLTAGLSWPKRPKHMAAMLDACGVMKWFKDTRGQTAGYHFWRDMLSVVAMVDDGVEHVHAMSDAYPTYDPETTNRFFEGAQAADKPARCGSFSMHSQLCSQCPHLGKITSPIELAFDKTIPVTQQAGLPYGFARNDAGELCWIHLDEKGVQHLRPILPGMLNALRVVSVPVHGETVTVERFFEIWWTPPGAQHPVRRQFPALELPTGDRTNQVLYWHNYDLPINPSASDKWKEFLMLSYREVLEKRRGGGVDTAPEAFGWDRDGSFATARRVFHPDGTTSDTAADDGLGGHYDPQGNYEAWRTAAQAIVDRLSPELQLLVASSFAAPLVSLLGTNSLLLNFTSRKTGTGKSSAMKVAVTAWGHPDHASMAITDTENAAFKKVGTLRHLPLFWDELRKNNSTELIFRLTQGKEKSRMGQQTQLREGGAWCTLLACASNDSLLDQAAKVFTGTQAGLARVFEVTVPMVKPEQHDQKLIDASVQTVARNFGHAGRVYAEYLAKNRQTLDTMINRLRAAFESRATEPSAERFWLSTAAALLAGAWAAEKAGILRFNQTALVKAVEQALIKLRRMLTVDDDELRAGDTGPLNDDEYARREAARFIDELLGELRPNLLKTDVYDPIPGRSGRVVIPIVQPQQGQHCELHISCNPPLLRVRKSTLHRFAVSRLIHWATVRDVWMPALAATSRFTCLASRTPWVTTQREVIEIPLTHPALAHLAIDERATAADSVDPGGSPDSSPPTGA